MADYLDSPNVQGNVLRQRLERAFNKSSVPGSDRIPLPPKANTPANNFKPYLDKPNNPNPYRLPTNYWKDRVAGGRQLATTPRIPSPSQPVPKPLNSSPIGIGGTAPLAWRALGAAGAAFALFDAIRTAGESLSLAQQAFENFLDELSDPEGYAARRALRRRHPNARLPEFLFPSGQSDYPGGIAGLRYRVTGFGYCRVSSGRVFLRDFEEILLAPIVVYRTFRAGMHRIDARGADGTYVEVANDAFDPRAEIWADLQMVPVLRPQDTPIRLPVLPSPELPSTYPEASAPIGYIPPEWWNQKPPSKKPDKYDPNTPIPGHVWDPIGGVWIPARFLKPLPPFPGIPPTKIDPFGKDPISGKPKDKPIPPAPTPKFRDRPKLQEFFPFESKFVPTPGVGLGVGLLIDTTPSTSPGSRPGMKPATPGSGSGSGGGGGSSSNGIPSLAPERAPIREKEPAIRQTPAGDKVFDPQKPFPFPPLIPARAGSPTPSPGSTGGSSTPTDPPSTSNPCRGNPCGQAQLDKLDKLQLALQGKDLIDNSALMNKLILIDKKLGNQLPGGLSGKLTRLSKWLQVDRIYNKLTFIAVLHNAYMLSNSLAITLFGALDNALLLIGVSDENSPIDTRQVFSSTVDNWAKQFFGVETWNGIKTEWKKLNRIYQAATNILFSIQSIGFSILEALEVVGSWVAQIGNAIRKYGVVWEKAFTWMNPNINFTTNKFFRALNNAQEAVENIDSITGELLNIQETARELADQQQQLKFAMEGKKPDGTPLDKELPREHQPTEEKERPGKRDSIRISIRIQDEQPPSSST